MSASIPYGFSFKKNIQESFYCKNIKLIVEGWISVEDIDNAGSIAIQVRQKDSSLYWNEIDLKQKVKEKNTWTFVTDTFTIPRCLMSDYKNEIFTFMWNKTGVGKTLGDDFYIKIVENKMPSFIPDVNPPENENYSETILKGNFNSIVYDKKNGLVSIADKNGKLLTSALTYYEDVLLNNKRGEVISCNRFLIKQKSNSSIILTTSSKTTDVTIEISSDINSPKLIFNANVKSKVDLQINRRSLILGYKDDLKQVYRKNTQIDTTSFQDEYWLNKEGCKIGEANRSIVFYRNNSISSTQLNAKRKILVFNFDFASDHLLMRFPVRDDDKKGIKTDVSANAVKSGSEQTYSLNLYVGSSVQTIPVFMQQPNAYLSSFIITEHADYTDLLTNYAVYYGSSDVNSSSKASGGFCKYKIPVTKSIFYHNPENTNNKIFNGAFTSEMSCWKDNVPYQKFINDIHSQGTEIAFHTPDYATSTREFMNDALSELTKKGCCYLDRSWL
ncbi:MAG: hypothetical protein IPG89_19350 [Bacteroidetes bacterium]|nr:hypothetical protein [Bacteroidota bacterium]